MYGKGSRLRSLNVMILHNEGGQLFSYLKNLVFVAWFVRILLYSLLGRAVVN
jgi:hypothetical protein